ncbi:unnamed protein product [Aureobasidium pullulans]|nr:unnamed protein product [Aureobasidium pullulans]
MNHPHPIHCIESPFSFPPPFENGTDASLFVPGFGGLPVKLELHPEDRFTRATLEWAQDLPTTARELAMLTLMDKITDRPNWFKEVLDGKAIPKLREKALGQKLISTKAWEWCLLELQDKARVFPEDKRTLVYNIGAGICKSDTIVDEGTRTLLKESIAVFMDSTLAAHDQRRHPAQLNTIVEPMMYPLIYGKSLYLDGEAVHVADLFGSISKAKVAPEPRSENEWNRKQSDRAGWSLNHQRLPCEAEFTGDTGTEVRVTSYINGIHPGFETLYAYCDLPDWDASIKSYGTKSSSMYKTTDDIEGWLEKGNCLGFLMWEQHDRLVHPVHPEPSDAYSYQQWKIGLVSEEICKENLTRSNCQYKCPDLDPSFNHKFYNVNLQDTFRNKGLQIIVKIVNVKLTPENPDFRGTHWHIEGSKNDHIVANSLYVFDSTNATASGISFRQENDIYLDDHCDVKDDDEALEDVLTVFAITDKEHIVPGYPCEAPALQGLGSVGLPEGRLIAWPNMLHHHLHGVELIDKDKAGCLSYVVLSLVDPYYRICSTRNVVPQDRRWWAEEAIIAAIPPGMIVPREIVDHINSFTGDWQLNPTEAEEVKERMTEDYERHRDLLMNWPANRYSFSHSDYNMFDVPPFLDMRYADGRSKVERGRV